MTKMGVLRTWPNQVTHCEGLGGSATLGPLPWKILLEGSWGPASISTQRVWGGGEAISSVLALGEGLFPTAFGFC